MSEMQALNIFRGDTIESLVGKEVKVKIKGILPLAKGTTRDYKEFVLAVESNKNLSDYRVYILMKSDFITRKRINGYSRFLSQIQIIPVEDGESVDVHLSEVQTLLEHLRY